MSEPESIREIASRLIDDLNAKRVERGITDMVYQLPPVPGASYPPAEPQEWPFELTEEDKAFLRGVKITYV